MKDLLERCAGLDVHKDKIVACILSGPLGKPTNSEIMEFSTLIPDMIALRDYSIRLPSCCYGKHRYLLAAHLRNPGRRFFRRHYPACCQCQTYEERPWQKDRYA